MLLERDAELSQLRSLLVDARGGTGCVVVIQGPPGIGKTTLSEAVCDEAKRAGFVALRARGSEFEREFAFGVARQLFEPLVHRGPAEIVSGPARLAGAMFIDADAPERARSDFDVFHSLYWLCANAAARHPLVLAIDDAHWADATTLGWLRYMARRIDELAVLVLVTVRSEELSDTTKLVGDVALAPSHVEISLAALSLDATGRLLQQTLGRVPDAAFVTASHRATGGNPFLLTELARAMREEKIEPRGGDVWRIGSLRPQSIVRSIDARVRRLSGAAQSLAQAAAVFGMDAEFRHAAALAGLDHDRAAEAADELLRASIIDGTDPIRFDHSLIRDAILADLTPARLARDHKRAADALAAEGVAADRVAGHLLLATPVADPGSARWLRKAGELALARGAPASAVTYFDRALLEPPPATDRPQLLWLLGRARLHAAQPGAIEVLQQALDATESGPQRAAVASELARAFMAVGRGREAYNVLEAALRDGEGLDRDRMLQLEGQMMAVAQLDHALIPVVRERASAFADLRGDTAGERIVLANVAYIRLTDGTPHEEVLRVAHLAARGSEIVRDGGADAPHQSAWLVRTLHHLGERDEAERLLGAMIDEAVASGSVLGFAIASLGRAAQSFSFGDLRATEEQARDALVLAMQARWIAGVPMAAMMRAIVAAERGDAASAMGLLGEYGLLGDFPEIGVLDAVLFHRALVFSAAGDKMRALADLSEVGRRERRSGLRAMYQWRAAAAPLLAAAGRRDEARALVEEELEVSHRRGTPRPLGIALRAAGLVEGSIARLERSAHVLGPTPFPLEIAKTAVELGAALRRANRRAEARPHLERALDLAFRCGATVVQRRAEEELAAAGARPRKLAFTGAEALTASERRVAQLAAAGRSNPEIAQLLFISRKTVETHLSRAYGKLGIDSRSELNRALEG